ncbi:hypothetical protein CKO28_13750 [Rhodovibrio sodomensis]|uniref:Uncharacterized protein n=1 Tax=Rhodovibrio sodomensis TaxID=1088 RepID=A0ABS1DH96_9PROT|nr:hypothetical protein [Rhodovibrio sodomensis]MBK1669098.1 hypothetical protein [Rhodovibrio sodomensis]
MATVVTKEALAGLLAGRPDILSMFRDHAQEPLMTGILSAQPATFEVAPQINPEDHVGAGLYCGPNGPMSAPAATA